jgi:hypothetical protein
LSQEWENSIFRDWSFADYREQQDILSLPRAKPSQSFEKFVASFHCLKSAVIRDNEPTTISGIHTGARLNGDIEFINHNLKFEFTQSKTDTNSEKQLQVNGMLNTIILLLMFGSPNIASG